MGDLTNKTLGVIVILVLTLSLLQIVIISIYTGKHARILITPKASQNTGKAQFCINHPPQINASNCSNIAYEDYTYHCRVSPIDPDAPSPVFWSYFILGEPLFNITTDGEINFTPTNEQVGNYSILLMFDDGSNCTNSYASEIIGLRVINVNDPPVLITDLPSFGIIEGSTIVPFYLLDYFDDPDIIHGDHLTFLSYVNDSRIKIRIDSTSRVLVKADDCPYKAIAIFTAIDDYNASTNSNPVEISVYCQGEGEEGPPGGGAGGGGGGLPPRVCTPDWHCGSWKPCNPNGTQYRECVDRNACDIDHYIELIWRNCTYYAQCFNGIQDPGEEGIDCGGPCPPCGTCTDGIQNCHDGLCEEGIDCGGPCPPCGNCSDGIKNCHNGSCEEDIDCGGPCPPCGNCFDGIQNCHDGACEEGIDCGGPCKPCVHIEKPFIEKNKFWTNLLVGLIAVLSLGVVIYAYFKREIDTAVNYLLEPVRKRKKKAILLKSSEAILLLEELHGIYESVIKMNREIGRAHNRELLIRIIKLYKKALSKRRELLARMFDLDISFTKEEIRKKIKKKIMPKPLKKWLSLILDDLFRSEKDIFEYILSISSPQIIGIVKKVVEKIDLTREEEELFNRTLQHYLYNIASLVEEARALIVSTSIVSKEEIVHLHEIEEKETMKEKNIIEKNTLHSHGLLDRLIKIDKYLRRGFTALQYGLIDQATDIYIEAVNIYNNSPMIMKARYYSLMMGARNAIDYYKLIPKEELYKIKKRKIRRKIKTNKKPQRVKRLERGEK